VDRQFPVFARGLCLEGSIGLSGLFQLFRWFQFWPSSENGVVQRLTRDNGCSLNRIAHEFGTLRWAENPDRFRDRTCLNVFPDIRDDFIGDFANLP